MPVESLLGNRYVYVQPEKNYNQSDWLKWVADRDPTTGQGNSGRQCLIVRDYIDLTEGANGIDELLCTSYDGIVFVDLGIGDNDQDLIINPENGTVYINGHTIDHLTGLQYLNDCSWGVKFGRVDYLEPKNRFLGFLQRMYSAWLELVYEKASWYGLIETSPRYEKSIWHLINPDLPKGKISSLNPKKVLDNDTLL